MLEDWIRRTGFWSLDALTGGKKKSHYDEIEKWNVKKGQHDLENILKYAQMNVPFYANLNSMNLEDFPVMTKSIFKIQKKRCMSKEFKNINKLRKVSTSGSTGNPMVVYQDAVKRNRVIVDLIRAHENIGWHLGEKYIFIRNWVSNYKQSKLKKIAENVEFVNIATFDDEHKINLYNYILKHKGIIIFGYSSSIIDFMNFLAQNEMDGVNLKIKLIVCDSDELSNVNKAKLKLFFRCPIINRYDNEENGLIAITKDGEDVFTVNYQSLKIELLHPKKDERVKPGELGRVIITDLFNHAMPLIRYDTGDFAISYDNPDNIKTLAMLCGRKADSLRSINGNLISAVAISGITEPFDSIIKYQLIQESKDDYNFKYIGTLSNTNQLAIDRRLRDSLGTEAKITFINVLEIPIGTNGKYKTIINKYNPIH